MSRCVFVLCWSYFFICLLVICIFDWGILRQISVRSYIKPLFLFLCSWVPCLLLWFLINLSILVSHRTVLECCATCFVMIHLTFKKHYLICFLLFYSSWWYLCFLYKFFFICIFVLSGSTIVNLPQVFPVSDSTSNSCELSFIFLCIILELIWVFPQVSCIFCLEIIIISSNCEMVCYWGSFQSFHPFFGLFSVSYSWIDSRCWIDISTCWLFYMLDHVLLFVYLCAGNLIRSDLLGTVFFYSGFVYYSVLGYPIFMLLQL